MRVFKLHLPFSLHLTVVSLLSLTPWLFDPDSHPNTKFGWSRYFVELIDVAVPPAGNTDSGLPQSISVNQNNVSRNMIKCTL